MSFATQSYAAFRRELFSPPHRLYTGIRVEFGYQKLCCVLFPIRLGSLLIGHLHPLML